jgi:hypothetical protein
VDCLAVFWSCTRARAAFFIVGIMVAACGSSSSRKGLSEACRSDDDCAIGHCSHIANGESVPQCSSSCYHEAASYCQQFDPRGICVAPDNLFGHSCTLSCEKLTDCPAGATCNAGGCYQN